MIEIICKEEKYSYNAYHMTKAFYPSEEIHLLVEEKASNFAEGNSENYVQVLFEDGGRIGLKKSIKKDVFEDEICPEPSDKHELDVALYKALAKKTNRTLAWGLLLGIRPTKLAMHKLEEGMREEDFVPWFQETSLVSEKKAKLAWKIAKREKALLDRLDYRDGYSLYVGIPFCPTVCSYCSFSSGSLSAWSHKVEAYVEALCKELKFIASLSKDKHLNTIYIGGGTPTTLTAGQLDKLLRVIEENFSFDYLLEYTVEAGRPDSISREKFQVLRDHGISRISINPQSMQQKTLDAIGRRHSVESVKEAFYLAREMGFDNINMDIIAGLADEGLEDMEDTIRQIEELGPDNLTVHSLAIKRAAKMGRQFQENRETFKDKTQVIESMIEAAREGAFRMGMEAYYLYRQKNIAGNFENVGYAKVDKAGIYNILIMEEKQSIIAAGAGATTKIVLDHKVPSPGSKRGKMTNLIRLDNVKAIDAYIDRVDEMIERKGEWLWH